MSISVDKEALERLQKESEFNHKVKHKVYDESKKSHYAYFGHRYKPKLGYELGVTYRNGEVIETNVVGITKMDINLDRDIYLYSGKRLIVNFKKENFVSLSVNKKESRRCR
jgi:hypothetical protein